MAPSRNLFRDAIAAGKTQIGFWQALANPVTVELSAAAGFDWLLLDGEHGPNTVPSLLAQLQAMNGYPSQPVLRLPSADPTLIKQYLDIGALTILVPMVESAEQARSIVAATRYAPQGTRGLAAGQVRASRWGRDTAYIDEANDSICVLAQVESQAGVAAIDEIAATDGIDGVFIGPADLAASLGYRGQPGHPDVLEVIEHCVDRTLSAGKAVGLLTLDDERARSYIKRGCTFVAVGTDVTVFSRAVDVLAAKFCGRKDGSASVGY